MGRVYRHEHRHVHGDPRHPDRREFAARYSSRARHCTQSIELGADRVSDRRNRRDPTDRLVDPRHLDTRRLSRLHLRLHRSEPGLRRLQQFLVARSGAGAAGLLRRRSDPARVLGDFSDVRGLGAEPGDPRRRLVGDAGANPRAAVGGFITDHYSWHWLFLINVPPGIVLALLVAWAVDIDRPDWRRLGSVDLVALPLLAVFLGSLQLVLKEAPHRGWEIGRAS